MRHGLHALVGNTKRGAMSKDQSHLPIPDVAGAFRTCSSCRRNLPPSSFFPQKKRAQSCKDCWKAAAAQQDGLCLDAQEELRSQTLEAGGTLGPCEMCGDPNVQAHRRDDQRLCWLCPLHHAAAHGKADSTRQMGLF